MRTMKLSKEDKIKYILAHPELSYDELAEELGYKSGESVRGFCKRNKLPNKRNNSQAQRTGENLAEMVAKVIKRKKKTVGELADTFNVPPKAIRTAIDTLQAQNKVIDSDDTGFQLAKDIQPVHEPLTIDFKKYKEIEYPIGFVTDNHIGSKYERLDVLNSLYDRFQEYGVQTVYNGGNMIDGEARFNKFDIYVHGVNDQVKNFVEKYPQRKGIITRFVTGDDHEGWYTQREHINVGQLIEDVARRHGREDLEFIGHMERDIVMKQSGGQSIIRVIHAGGGSTYAISYTSQKYVESLQGGEKPHIVLVGHFHKFDWSYPRGVHVVQGGCTEDQTPFMRKKRIEAHVGGVVLWVKQNELGVFTSVKVEWLPYFDKKFYQYKW